MGLHLELNSRFEASIYLVGADGYRASNLSGTTFDETVLWKNDCARGNPSVSSCAPWSLGIVVETLSWAMV